MLAFSQVGSKRSPSPDLTWTNETFSASQYKMLPFMSIRRQLQTKGLSDSISSNIWLRFWVLTVCFWDLLQQLFACTEWDVNLSRLQSDHMIKLGHIAIAAANMTEIVATPTTLDIQLATAGAKNLPVDGTPSRQRLSKRLLQACIALILMGCDKRMVDMWNILKVLHFHVCMGSRTIWPRLNCWSCNLSRLHSIKWLGLLGRCVHSGQDSTDKLDWCYSTHLCHWT